MMIIILIMMIIMMMIMMMMMILMIMIMIMIIVMVIVIVTEWPILCPRDLGHKLGPAFRCLFRWARKGCGGGHVRERGSAVDFRNFIVFFRAETLAH